MGLIITSEINTDSGTTSNAYVNLSRFDVMKDTGANAFVNLYLNKEARDIDAGNTCSSKVIVKRFGINAEELDSSAIYNSLYARLRFILEEVGFIVEDDI